MATMLMLTTARGSEDGFSVKLFEEGKTYEVYGGVAWRFLHEGKAKVIQPEAIEAIQN